MPLRIKIFKLYNLQSIYVKESYTICIPTPVPLWVSTLCTCVPISLERQNLERISILTRHDTLENLRLNFCLILLTLWSPWTYISVHWSVALFAEHMQGCRKCPNARTRLGENFGWLGEILINNLKTENKWKFQLSGANFHWH